MTYLYKPGTMLARFCFGNLGRLEVTGRECVPPYGPLIVVANHVSYNDPPALVSSVSRPLNFFGKKELFGNPVGRFLMPKCRVYPVDRASGGVDAMRTVIDLLSRDETVVLFPEGHVSPDHAMRPAQGGVALLAIKTQAPILPVGIYGAEKFSHWRMPFPLCRFHVNIGQPFTPPVLEGRVSRDAVNSVLSLIMGRVAELLPREYQGVYAPDLRRTSPGGSPSRASGRTG